MLLQEVKVMNRRDFGLFAAGVAIAVACPANGADNLQLWVDGDIRAKGGIGIGDSELSALAQQSFETSTVWTEGVRRFSGPPLHLLLEKLGAGPGNLRLTAVNNYSVDVSRNLLTPDSPIIANRIDGMVFDRRSKGPFWVMFPFDQIQEFQTETVFAACVWQLSRITVLED